MRGTADQKAYMAATTADRAMRHLVTVALRGGSTYYWTDETTDIVSGGHTFLAGGQGTTVPIVKVGGSRQCAGLEIGHCSLTMLCGDGALLGTTPLVQAAHARAFDGATVTIERLYGDGTLGTVPWFKGPTGEVSISGTKAEGEVESGVAFLNIQLPRHTFSPGCQNILFDSACGLTKGDFTVTGTVGAGSSTTVVTSNRTEATGTTNSQGFFALGVLTFAGGTTTVALRNVSRRVIAYSATNGAFTLDRPLPAVPAESVDAFSVYPGCPKTMAACANNTASAGPTFNNVTHFNAEPFVPRNEAALG